MKLAKLSRCGGGGAIRRIRRSADLRDPGYVPSSGYDGRVFAAQKHVRGLISACEGGSTITGSVYVARVSLIPEATYTQVSVGGDGSFTPNLYVVRTSAANACDFDNPGGGDTGACQTASSIAVLAINIPPGEYFLIVGKSDFDPEGACGNFTLTSNGNFHVSLQSFTVG